MLDRYCIGAGVLISVIKIPQKQMDLFDKQHPATSASHWERADPRWLDHQFTSRMRAGFRPTREDDPGEWDARMAFWTALIEASADPAVAGSRQASLRVRERTLADQFTQQGSGSGSAPQCLGQVLEHMEKQGLIMTRKSFSESSSIFARVAQFAAARILTASPVLSPLRDRWLGPKTQEEYVLLNPLKSLAEKMLLRHQENALHAITDNVLLESEFLKECAQLSGLASPDDARLVLRQLERMGNASIRQLPGSNEKVIKISTQIGSFEDTDVKIGSIKYAQSLLVKHIQDLQSRIDEFKSKALALATTKRNEALRCVKLKRELEVKLEQQHSALHNIEKILLEIQNLEVQREIMRSYVASVDVIRDVRKAFGLDVDKIDATMMDLQDVLDEQAEIDSALQSGGNHDNIDMDELERELAALSVEPATTAAQDPPVPAASTALNSQASAANVASEVDAAAAKVTADAQPVKPAQPPRQAQLAS
ncbi:hypothetical protein CAOG_06524 [Capsaspora owczarzaki ATCC 30864]|uniref:Charged multivesicular body protein 7 n=1 Tax=Capsaspora owczarzaki (strain ATCC 30864) TaxID=595528 RepID=A0A0D2UM66_CAPO3|nr:hypothetical protein CAOG_06524 [Capsaspora owczarzaki ATCC 30864]KJE96161.1 hypothetical protein CAOG_006524 [Capsaspora owczarzaki ATCC 30864]|eukprot:XP_004345273.1 hypothetical protein CAOG_06524 [Capsaspora owczarzaki ATCC 30864]